LVRKIWSAGACPCIGQQAVRLKKRNMEMGNPCGHLPRIATFVKIVIAFFVGSAAIALVLFTLKKDFWKSKQSGQWPR